MLPQKADWDDSFIRHQLFIGKASVGLSLHPGHCILPLVEPLGLAQGLCRKVGCVQIINK